MTSSILIIKGSKADSIINQIESLIKNNQESSSLVYNSLNDKVECHVTSSLTDKVDSYISQNNTFTYSNLLKYLKENKITVSNVMLSGYLKKKNCIRLNYKATNGSYTKVWTKVSL